MNNFMLCEFRKIEKRNKTDGSAYHLMTILFNDNSTNVTVNPTKDNADFISELYKLDRGTEFRMFYDLYIKYDGNWGIKPTAIDFEI